MVSMLPQEELCSATSQAASCQHSSGSGSLSRLLSSTKDVQLQFRPAPCWQVDIPRGLPGYQRDV